LEAFSILQPVRALFHIESGLRYGSALGMLMGLMEQASLLGWESEDDAVRSNWVTTCDLLLWRTPAIGGFVVVMQMLKSYGSCAQLY
jgi:hypothetical protein